MKKLYYDSSHQQLRIFSELHALFKYRHLISELISRNIKSRYKRSILGVAWTMINPLLTMLVLYIVFSQLFAHSIPRYAVYLLSGLLLWSFFAQSTVAAIRDLVWSGGLLQRIAIPRSLFALAAVGTGLINLLLALIPLAIVAFISGSKLSWALFFLPVSLMLAAIFSLGVGLGLSSMAVFFTDIVDMYQIILLAWMYLTPILYPIEILPEQFRGFLIANPMYYILECFRMPIYLGVLPSIDILIKATLAATLSLFLGSWLFVRKYNDFAYIYKNNAPFIQLDNISVRYRMHRDRSTIFKEHILRWIRRQNGFVDFWALKDISLSVGSGESIGIIGSNGAGKSTLLKVIAQVLHPTDGRVRVSGLVAPILSLGAGFDMELTGRENVYLNGAMLGFSRTEMNKKMPALLEFSMLKDFIDAPYERIRAAWLPA
jgi:ABC-type polysaccharide/polyol phosphate export permease